MHIVMVDIPVKGLHLLQLSMIMLCYIMIAIQELLLQSGHMPETIRVCLVFSQTQAKEGQFGQL